MKSGDVILIREITSIRNVVHSQMQGVDSASSSDSSSSGDEFDGVRGAFHGGEASFRETGKPYK